MDTKKPSVIVCEYIELAFRQGNLSAADKFIAKDHVASGKITENYQGHKGQREFVRLFLDGFSNITVTINKQSASPEGWVTTDLTFTGLNNKPFMNNPATGRNIKVNVILHNKVVDGVIHESVSEWEPAIMQAQLYH